MTYVHSFPAVVPPARYDAVPWTQVECWESDDATPTGTYALIESQAVAADPTPASPSLFSLTITLAELPASWYRFRFEDGAGNFSGFSDPVASPPDASLTTYQNVAGYAKMHMGGENWDILTTSESYGKSSVLLAIEAVKRRVMASPPITALEGTLSPLVLDYLGILSALALLPAARDAWASRTITQSIGNDPREISTYTDRAKGIDDLLEHLLRLLPAIQAAALPELDQPVSGSTVQPGIDEDDDYKVTDDPRDFPPATTFPYPRCFDVRSYP
jgi:hypothetical protein